eukprot:scaffold15389_cov131-Isochrysis_galbana.AAC.6
MLDMNVTAEAHRGVSTTYTMTVGMLEASDSEMMEPEADQARGACLDQPHDVLEAGGKQVERGEDAAVGAELILAHHLAVVDRVTDVDVRAEGRLEHRRVEVDQVVRRLALVQVRVEPLHERGLAAARHAEHNASDRALLRGAPGRAGSVIAA